MLHDVAMMFYNNTNGVTAIKLLFFFCGQDDLKKKEKKKGAEFGAVALPNTFHLQFLKHTGTANNFTAFSCEVSVS